MLPSKSVTPPPIISYFHVLHSYPQTVSTCYILKSPRTVFSTTSISYFLCDGKRTQAPMHAISQLLAFYVPILQSHVLKLIPMFISDDDNSHPRQVSGKRYRVSFYIGIRENMSDVVVKLIWGNLQTTRFLSSLRMRRQIKQLSFCFFFLSS